MLSINNVQGNTGNKHISLEKKISGKLLCPWDFPGKNAGVGCPFLLQGSSQPTD